MTTIYLNFINRLSTKPLLFKMDVTSLPPEVTAIHWQRERERESERERERYR